MLCRAAPASRRPCGARMQHLGDWQSLGAGIDAAERGSARASWRAGTWHDVRYALRSMRKNPAFAAIAVLTLAFGIGGNTAIFTMVDAVALRNLPYRDPDRLMAIETRKTAQPEIEPWTSAARFPGFPQAGKVLPKSGGGEPGVERGDDRARRGGTVGRAVLSRPNSSPCWA